MLRKFCLAPAALAVCLMLSACGAERKEPEPKRVGDRPPDSRLKGGPEKDMGMGGAVGSAK